MSRTLSVALLAGLALLLMLGSWFRTGWQSSAAEATAIRQAPRLAAKASLGELAMELTNRLDQLRNKENGRPYYHYQNLFHDPRGLSEGKSVIPSPLVEATGDPFIGVHFQIDDGGTLSIPPINGEVERLSYQPTLEKNLKLLAQLRSAQDALRDGPAPIAMTSPLRQDKQEQQQAVPKQIVQQATFPQEVFAQNAAPNQVFAELESKGKNKDAHQAPTASPPTAIEVATHGFRWREAEIAGRPELVALRRIETPEGNLTQGFVIDAQAVAAWIGARAPKDSSTILGLSRPLNRAQLAVPMPALSGWQLERDLAPEEALAHAQARRVVRDFLWRFIPAAILGILLTVAVVSVVSRAERLAHERSEFAAAAAHELRTPLAGLQLYGDMLAEGLGDQNAKDKYAKCIADEAQRLGRVVSNVLDFSQMEKNGVTLHPKRGNLAETIRSLHERLRRPLEHAGMHLDLQAPESLEAIYDDDAVARILQNLMDNAEKYTRDHELRRIELVVDSLPSYARVTVSDGGAGVKRSMRSQIFKPFRRNAGKDGPAGLGLGLALARTLARQQGGDLLVQDSALGGAAFVLQLPRFR